MNAHAAPALLAHATRCDMPEVLVRGHVAAVDASGALIASAGDAAAVATLRSAVKPLQALPFLESGAAASCADPVAALAIACGSHRGEPVHVDTVRSMLEASAATEDDLECGASLPSDRRARESAIASGTGAQRVFHNCSGKHASMIALARQHGWHPAGYRERQHDVQAEVRRSFRAHAGIDLDAAPTAIDGCGVPTWGLPLRDLAAGMARAAGGSAAFAVAVAAMRAHPQLVAGTGAFDTVLLSASPDGIAGKSGAAGIWVGVSLARQVAVAVKLEAGLGAYIAPIAIAALTQLGLLDHPGAGELAPFAAPDVTNSRGEQVGHTRALLQLA